ncbi:MAG: hypothetical protein OXE94_05115 [Aestuariivita sp.]|nr:hypothetical protein [Aestuariivita sp.]MCY4201960.1 hypothetical protein [Aestuariivita sp.]MCY4288844.1 hypothetical protein [Aestuariivita sp.]MCY4345235.1 hypothetical protein [Aestuariivita sp.]
MRKEFRDDLTTAVHEWRQILLTAFDSGTPQLFNFEDMINKAELSQIYRSELPPDDNE